MATRIRPLSWRRWLALTFGFLGGAIAWTLHLLLAYLIAEFGCLLRWDRFGALGISLVAWLIIGLTVFCLALAGAATLASYRRGSFPPGLGRRGLGIEEHSRDPADAESPTPESYLAVTGLIMNAVFIFIILVETIPILFYLTEC